MAAIDKVRVIVVGDSGVGKTSLVHLLCHGEPMLNTSWTIGCSVEVKLHEYKVGTPQEKTYFIELWDVGGSSSHKNTRATFYNPVHGIVLVHDLKNRKSQQNLRKWLAEVLNREQSENDNSYDYDPEQFAGNQIPILVVGTNLNQVQDDIQSRHSRNSSIAEECGADQIILDCTENKHLAPGSSNSVRLSRFFDKVIQRRYFARDNSAPVQEKQTRRPVSNYGASFKSAHYD